MSHEKGHDFAPKDMRMVRKIITDPLCLWLSVGTDVRTTCMEGESFSCCSDQRLRLPHKRLSRWQPFAALAAKCHRSNHIKDNQPGCPLNIGRGHRFLTLVSTLAPPVIHAPSSRLLAVPQLPYVAETTNAELELSILQMDTDVQDLRDQHHADLVVLVGDFSQICGLA